MTTKKKVEQMPMDELRKLAIADYEASDRKRRDDAYDRQRPKHCSHPDQAFCDCDWCRFLRGGR